MVENEHIAVIEKRVEDCLPCKIISGCVIVGLGCYLGFQGIVHTKKYNKYGLYGLSAATFLYGFARLLDLGPFQRSSDRD